MVAQHVLSLQTFQKHYVHCLLRLVQCSFDVSVLDHCIMVPSKLTLFALSATFLLWTTPSSILSLFWTLNHYMFTTLPFWCSNRLHFNDKDMHVSGHFQLFTSNTSFSHPGCPCLLTDELETRRQAFFQSELNCFNPMKRIQIESTYDFSGDATALVAVVIVWVLLHMQ